MHSKVTPLDNAYNIYPYLAPTNIPYSPFDPLTPPRLIKRLHTPLPWHPLTYSPYVTFSLQSSPSLCHLLSLPSLAPIPRIDMNRPGEPPQSDRALPVHQGQGHHC